MIISFNSFQINNQTIALSLILVVENELNNKEYFKLIIT